MKIIKALFLGLLILIGLVLVIAAFAPKNFQSERSVVINRNKSEVYHFLKYVKNQDQFGVWQLSDPEMQTREEGQDGTVGFTYYCEGKKVGKGSQKILRLVSGERIETELNFGFGEPAQAYFVTEGTEVDQTRVTWGMQGKSPYPFNIFGLIFDVGEDFEQGLENLKELLESDSFITDSDQAHLLDRMEATFSNLQAEIGSMDSAQFHFRAAAGTWTPSECAEHILLTEEMLFGALKERMLQPAENLHSDQDSLIALDERIESGITDRTQKYQAPKELTPTGRFSNPSEALSALENQRDDLLEFLRQTPSSELRNRLLSSPFGTVDGVQWLLFLAGHTERHTLQIAEAKSNPKFPITDR